MVGKLGDVRVRKNAKEMDCKELDLEFGREDIQNKKVIELANEKLRKKCD